MKLLYIDLFCGAGGTSTGVEKARMAGEQCAKVIACVNHDEKAIASHAANHPDALHFVEDIRTLELSPLVAHVEKMRKEYPSAFVVLWASLECTNFSRAKGGLPRDADSRTLAEHLFRYIEAVNPSYIQIENVEEFMSWGDVDEKGKPISKDRGRLYQRWIKNVKKYGYNFDHKILNAADFGAYTTRRRFFGIFAKKGLPIVWPEQTHSKDGCNTLFGQLHKWKPVREVLDLSDKGESIFDREKPLVDKTLERIYAGLIKFVAGGREAFMIKYNSMSQTGKYNAPGIDQPCPTVSCQNRIGVASVNFFSKHFSGHPESKNISIEGPAGAITTIDHHSLVSVFLQKYYSGDPSRMVSSVNAPASTLRTKDSLALVSSSFLASYYGNGDNVSHVNAPCPTVPTKDRFSYVCPEFISSYYSGGGQNSDINKPCPAVLSTPKQRIVSCLFVDQQYGNSKPASPEKPLGCLTATPKYNLVSCQPWVMNTSFGNIGSNINDPAPVITANRKWHYLMNPQFTSPGGSIDKPAFTLIARMDKRPPYLIEAETGQFGIAIYETDTPAMIKIKEFMAMYNIVDIKMRMLRIGELKRIMGFPSNYVLMGSQEKQKKFIGNAVEVNMSRVLCEALCKRLSELNIKPLNKAA